MIADIYQIWKDFWKWLNGLTTKTVALVCVTGAVIGCLVFTNWMLYNLHKSTDTAPMVAELTAMRTEFAHNDSIIMREIRAVAEQVNGVDTKVSKVILIVAANSNNDLIRRLVPYLENVATKQDIYSFVLDIQRDYQQREVQKRDSVKFDISVKKITE